MERARGLVALRINTVKETKFRRPATKSNQLVYNLSRRIPSPFCNSCPLLPNSCPFPRPVLSLSVVTLALSTATATRYNAPAHAIQASGADAATSRTGSPAPAGGPQPRRPAPRRPAAPGGPGGVPSPPTGGVTPLENSSLFFRSRAYYPILPSITLYYPIDSYLQRCYNGAGTGDTQDDPGTGHTDAPRRSVGEPGAKVPMPNPNAHIRCAG